MPDVDETRSRNTPGIERAFSSPITPPRGFPAHPLIILLALSLLAAAIYSNTISASFQFDDIRVIVENPLIKRLKFFFNVSDARYVGDLSFALNYRIGGLDVFGYHVVNILIHVTNSFLLYLLVLLLCRTPTMVVTSHQSPGPVPSNPPMISAAPNDSHGMALFASLLFLAHPIQTQAVTYIVQRFTSLATLFYLLTVVCYVKWRLARPEETGRYLWYMGAVLCTVLAMKSKEISFTLPLMLVLVEALFYRSLTRKHWLAMVPFLVTLFIIPLSHMGELHAVATHGMGADLSTKPAALDTIQSNRWAIVLTQVRAAMTYFRLLIVPIDQNLDYEYPIYHSLLDPAVVFSTLALLSLIVLTLSLLRRSEQSVYNAQWRFFAFGILWGLLTLALETVFSILVFRDPIIEHRLYLPSVGFFVAASAAGSWLYQRMPDRLHWIAICLAACCVALLSVASYQRNRVWRDELSLWTDVVKKSPGKVRPHINLGIALRHRGALEGAIAEYRTALRLNPNDASAYDNLGVALYDTGALEGAIGAYRTALRLNPNDANAYDNLGVALYTKGDLEGAIGAYRTALLLNPNDENTYYNLGEALNAKGDLEEAIVSYRTALRLSPNDVDACNHLGLALYATGDLGGAIAAYRAAIRLAPNAASAHYHLGVALMDQGDVPAAAKELQASLRLAPNTPAMRRHIDDAQRRLGILTGTGK